MSAGPTAMLPSTKKEKSWTYEIFVTALSLNTHALARALPGGSSFKLWLKLTGESVGEPPASDRVAPVVSPMTREEPLSSLIEHAAFVPSSTDPRHVATTSQGGLAQAVMASPGTETALPV